MKTFRQVARILFVFSIGDPPKNVGSLLTPVSDPVFYSVTNDRLHSNLFGSLITSFLKILIGC